MTPVLAGLFVMLLEPASSARMNIELSSADETLKEVQSLSANALGGKYGCRQKELCIQNALRDGQNDGTFSEARPPSKALMDQMRQGCYLTCDNMPFSGSNKEQVCNIYHELQAGSQVDKFGSVHDLTTHLYDNACTRCSKEELKDECSPDVDATPEKCTALVVKRAEQWLLEFKKKNDARYNVCNDFGTFLNVLQKSRSYAEIVSKEKLMDEVKAAQEAAAQPWQELKSSVIAVLEAKKQKLLSAVASQSMSEFADAAQVPDQFDMGTINDPAAQEAREARVDEAKAAAKMNFAGCFQAETLVEAICSAYAPSCGTEGRPDWSSEDGTLKC